MTMRIDLFAASEEDIANMVLAEEKAEAKRKAMAKALREKLKAKLDAKKV